ncbi:MAG: hypothetical protein JWQ89_943 [Devosia sp.]|uniref:hypothetical protein n=1 Tax=Devosia sp. TaxID=1871048 RepID=UPI002614D4CE|nr:hypothetical protein [Devosia sp.]MDB5539216.1 hypothetical protein [Devosia sp.]
MNPLVIVGALALFLVLVLLLLSLNLTSLWKWWIKAAAIVVALGSVIVLYFTMTGLIGWASPGQMPPRFSVLATRVVEPDLVNDLPGRIYLWVEEVDDRQVTISPPRAFELPYEISTAGDVATAQEMIEDGGRVLGAFGIKSDEALPPPGEVPPEGAGATSTKGRSKSTERGGEGADKIRDSGAISFSAMPPVDLPNKNIVYVDRDPPAVTP